MLARGRLWARAMPGTKAAAAQTPEGRHIPAVRVCKRLGVMHHMNENMWPEVMLRRGSAKKAFYRIRNKVLECKAFNHQSRVLFAEALVASRAGYAIETWANEAP